MLWISSIKLYHLSKETRMKRKREAFVKVLEKIKLVLINIRFKLDISMPVMVTNLGIGFWAWQWAFASAFRVVEFFGLFFLFFFFFFFKSSACCTIRGTWTVQSGQWTVNSLMNSNQNIFFYCFQFSVLVFSFQQNKQYLNAH